MLDKTEKTQIQKIQALIKAETDPEIVKSLKKEIYCIESYYTKNGEETREILGIDGVVRQCPIQIMDMRRVPISLSQAITELEEFD